MERENERTCLDAVEQQAKAYGLDERQVRVLRGLARICYSYGRCDVLEELTKRESERSIGTARQGDL